MARQNGWRQCGRDAFGETVFLPRARGDARRRTSRWQETLASRELRARSAARDPRDVRQALREPAAIRETPRPVADRVAGRARRPAKIRLPRRRPRVALGPRTAERY